MLHFLPCWSPAGRLRSRGSQSRGNACDLLTLPVFYLNSASQSQQVPVVEELEVCLRSAGASQLPEEANARVLIQGSDCLDSVRAAAGLLVAN